MSAIAFLHLQPNATRAQLEGFRGKFNDTYSPVRIEGPTGSPSRWEVLVPKVEPAGVEDEVKKLLTAIDPEWTRLVRVTGAPQEIS